MRKTFRYNKRLGGVELVPPEPRWGGTGVHWEVRLGRDDSLQAIKLLDETFREPPQTPVHEPASEVVVVVSVSVSVSVYINSGVVEEFSWGYRVVLEDSLARPALVVGKSLGFEWGEGLLRAARYKQYPMKLLIPSLTREKGE